MGIKGAISAAQWRAVERNVPKGYIYFAMGFSVLVELLNIRVRRRKARSRPVKLHRRYARSEEPDSPQP